MELEINNRFVEEIHQKIQKTISGNLIFTPPLDEDYWLFRVKLFKEQSVVAFPKFFTFGIGFSQEEDWNCNFKYTTEAEKICEHIWRNRKHKEITKNQVIEAIKMLQNACVEINKFCEERNQG